MKRKLKNLSFLILLAVSSCGRSDRSQPTQATKVEAPSPPDEVQCAVAFKDTLSPYKVGLPYKIKVSAAPVDPADIVVASTHGSTTTYAREQDGYDYVLTAKEPGTVKLLVFHKTEVGENPLCTFEYVFE